MKTFFLSVLLAMAGGVQAKDLGFRFQNGQCLNAAGKQGLNPGYIGQCADLGHVMMSRFDFEDADLSGSRFDASDVQESSFKNANLSGVSFVGSNLAGATLDGAIAYQTNFESAVLVNTHFAGAKFTTPNFKSADFSASVLSYCDFTNGVFAGAKFTGAILDHVIFKNADLSNADLSGIELKGAVLDGAQVSATQFLSSNLSGASLRNISGAGSIWRGAMLRQADLSHAQIQRSNFRAAQLDGANLTDADLSGSDIRSASLKAAQVQRTQFANVTYSPRTVLPFGPDEAKGFGMLLSKAGRLLVIWDYPNGSTAADFVKMKSVLDSVGIEVALAPQLHSEFDGSLDLSDYTAIIFISSTGYSKDIPVAGQTALLNFVKNGGTYLGTQYSSYMLDNNRLTTMRDLTLLSYKSSSSGSKTYNFDATNATHPLLDGITQGTAVTCYQSSTSVRAQNSGEQTQVLVHDQSGDPLVSIRNVGAGKVINFAWVLNTNGSCLESKMIQQMLINAVNW